MSRSSGTTLKAGTTTYWAKQPSPWTPRIFVFSQMCRRPVRQGRQAPQVTCISAETY